MRGLFILFVAALFVAYCLGVKANYTTIAIPQDEVSLKSLSRKGYRLRNNFQPEKSLGKHGYPAGTHLTKPVLDALIAAKMTRVGIVGKGDIVALQPGTMLMVILIFLALVAALKGVLWDPLEKIVLERDEKISEGLAVVSDNASKEKKFADESVRLRNEARRDFMSKLGKARHEALSETHQIVEKARVEADEIRAKTVAELAALIKEAETSLQREVPALADEIVKKVLGHSA